MPRRAPSRCTQCKQMATQAGRCDDHQVKAWARPSANTRQLNGRQREQLRQAALRRDPTCALCGADDPHDLILDHVIEIADGGAPLDQDNTWLLCGPCNKQKTANARRARAAKRRRTM